MARQDRPEAAPAPGGTATAPGAAEPPAPVTTAGRGWVAYLLMAVVCYVPSLATKPGVVSDDTKTYLYYDPGTLLRQALSMWDPSVALGTVTHQTIGYLLPMGPFFWFFSLLHVPVWVAQRLWLGSILFAAAAGVLYLCRVLGITGAGRVVAALSYAIAPYVMQYAGRISVILLPASGLPWMMAFIVLACRHRTWRYPALFALVVALVSGINASSIVYVGVAPILWILYSTFVLRELSGRQALGVVARTGLLTLLASLWWIAGLSIEGLYGVDILKYTESVEATSSASSAAEVIRGLGYWYFYGGDRMGLWTKASAQYTTRLPLLAASYFVPVAAFASAAFVRWRHRAFFALLVVAGLVLSVGPYPYVHPTPFGSLDKAFMNDTTVGLSLRSTDRATPLVLLGLAMLLGTGVTALVARWSRPRGLAVVGAVVALVLAANAPLLAGESVISQFSQPARPPSYVEAAAHYLNGHSPGTRVYALPGDDFAAYTYGDTVDPIWPAVLTRPFAIHEQQIMGSMATANLLYALDNPLQQGTMDWRALAPVARLISAGDVLVEYDDQYARYDSPRPALLEHDLATTPPGLGAPIDFGLPTVNHSTLAMYDETYFDLPPVQATPPPVVVYPVSDPRAIERAESLADPLVLDGDDVGVVEAADHGLLAKNPTILFAGTLAGDRALRAAVGRAPATLVVTDTNRKQAFEWNSLSENTGYTETASQSSTPPFLADDPGFDLFPAAGTAGETTSILTEVRAITASAFGTAFTLRSEFRPANAFDGNLSTAWETEGTAEGPAVGQWWQVALRHPVTADEVRLVQPLPARDAPWLTNQYLTKVTLTFDGTDAETVRLGPSSRTPGGQVVSFPSHRFSRLRIRIDATNFSTGNPPPVGSSLVGLAEVELGDLHTTQIVDLPHDLVGSLGARFLADRLVILLERDRVAPVPPRSQPEVSMIREWSLPTARSFSLTGTAHLSTAVADPVVDALVGLRPGAGGDPLVTAASSTRMPGSIEATAARILDGPASRVYMPGLGRPANVGASLTYRFARPLRLGSLSFLASSSAEHSRPTAMTVTASGVTRTLALPPVPVTPGAGSQRKVTVHFAPVEGRTVTLRFTKVKVRNTLSYETSLETALPIGIASLDLPGTTAERLPAAVPSTCRSDLLEIDGRPVPIRLVGSASNALAGGGLEIRTCGSMAAGVHLSAGTHLLEAAPGATTGIDLDELALDSAPGGAPETEPAGGGIVPAAPGVTATTPKVVVTSQSSTAIDLHVTGATHPFLLVLGESIDAGWHATADGVDLGAPVLVDGFANGWWVSGRDLAAISRTGSFEVSMDFAPEREVDLALVVSGLSILACVGIACWPRRRRRRRHAPVEEGDHADHALGQYPSPVVVSPLSEAPPDKQPRVVVATVVLSGLIGYAVAGVAPGVVVAISVALTMTLRRGRSVLTLGAFAAMVVAVAEVLHHQMANRFPPGSGWPSYFELASEIVWVAVALLGVDAVIEFARRRRHLRREEAAAAAESLSSGAPAPAGGPSQAG